MRSVKSDAKRFIRPGGGAWVSQRVQLRNVECTLQIGRSAS